MKNLNLDRTVGKPPADIDQVDVVDRQAVGRSAVLQDIEIEVGKHCGHRQVATRVALQGTCIRVGTKKKYFKTHLKVGGYFFSNLFFH
mgnify:CR=1 FL=1